MLSGTVKKQLHWWSVWVEQPTLFLSNIRKKKERRWYFICTGHSHFLTSHLTAGHAAWERERGCKHFLPSKQPAESALVSLPFPPWGGTGHSSRRCGRQFQPQGYVISVHHSLQYSSQSSSAHKNTTGLANHFSRGEALANKRWKKKAVKSLSETPLHKIFLGFPAALKSCLSLFMYYVQSQEVNMRSPQTFTNAWLYHF